MSVDECGYRAPWRIVSWMCHVGHVGSRPTERRPLANVAKTKRYGTGGGMHEIESRKNYKPLGTRGIWS